MTLIRHIPVFLAVGDQDPVGFGTIEDGKLTIVVENELVVDGIERLIRIENINELYLGVSFSLARGVTERRIL